jgi:outer membrane protein
MSIRFSPRTPLACAALLMLPCWGQQSATTEPAAESGSQWALGAGVGVERSPYAGYGNRTRALPLLMYNGPRFRLLGTTADPKLGAVGRSASPLRAQYATTAIRAATRPS